MDLLDLVARFSLSTTYAQVIVGCIACIVTLVWLTGRMIIAAIDVWAVLLRRKRRKQFLKQRGMFEWRPGEEEKENNYGKE